RSRAMWAGGPPKPVTPIRVHSRATVSSEAAGAGSSPPSVIEYLVGELLQCPAGLPQGLSPLRGDLVDAPRAAQLDRAPGAQQPLGLEPVQGRRERAGADLVAVPGQLARHPGAVDLPFGGVMEDVELDGPAEELAHADIEYRYRLPIVRGL